MELTKIIAILSWVAQLLNAVVATLTSSPFVENVDPVGLAAKGESVKTIIFHTAIAAGLGLLQGFLPRIQPKQ